jgi:uncharacterized protein
VEQRISLVTLGVADVARARAFYEALGWQTNAAPDDDVVFFQSGGMILAIWGRDQLAEDSGVEDAGGWGGVTLAHNVRSPEEVDAVLAEAERAGARIPRRGRRDLLGRLLRDLRRPRRASVGGRPQPALDARRRRVGAALAERSPSGSDPDVAIVVMVMRPVVGAGAISEPKSRFYSA